MKKVLIATWNPGKKEMFKNLLKDNTNIEFLWLSDFESVEEPDENWKTVEDNALIKAKYYGDKFNIITLADDAWFEIKDLDWEPWVKARRWWWELPDNVSDEDWLEFFLERTKNLDKKLLEWSFPFARCLYFPSWKYYFQSETIPALFSREPRRPFIKGWPLSSICIEKNGIHRLDIPESDPYWNERLKKEWLMKLLEKINNFTK